eukprot:2534996-Rhodomonas_salina.2
MAVRRVSAAVDCGLLSRLPWRHPRHSPGTLRYLDIADIDRPKGTWGKADRDRPCSRRALPST